MRIVCVGLFLFVIACTGSVEGDVTTGRDDAPADETPAPENPDPVVVPPPSTKLAMFVAQGKGGRTVISCDDGLTWVADHDDFPELDCGTTDCDHQAGSGTAITYDKGYFLASFGWGYPGQMRRSADGVTWETVMENSNWADMTSANGYVVATNGIVVRSADGGTTWDEAVQPALAPGAGQTRRIAFADIDDGLFVLTSQSSALDIMLSNDNTATWWHPDTLPTSCGMYSHGAAGGNGTIVVMNQYSSACTSNDKGKTFVERTTSFEAISSLIFRDGEFRVWGYGARFSSPDGVTWTETRMEPGITVGAFAISDNGTFVTVTGAYDSQQFWRSVDGVHWTEVDGPGGHPIRNMAWGVGRISDVCPSANR